MCDKIDFLEKDFLYFILALRHTKKTSEVDRCWQMISSQYPDTRVTISVNDETFLTIPQCLNCSLISSLFDNKALLQSYYSTESLHFLNNSLLQRKSSKKQIKLNLDYAIFIDTNFASYINCYVQRQPLLKNPKDPQWRTIVKAINYLLDDGVTYDYSYYILENTKQVFPVLKKLKNSYCTPQDFWNQLNLNFRKNLISLLLFKSIDREAYRISPSIKYKISQEEAEKIAIKQTYELFFEEDAEIPRKIMSSYNITYLLLIETIRVDYETKKGVRKKLSFLLDFMHDNLGFIAEREAAIACKFFEQKSKLDFFDKVNKGKHWNKEKLQKKLQNMAWDLMIPRYIEIILSLLARSADLDGFFPYFLTFDEDLHQILELYPVRGTIYEAKSHQIIPIPDIDVYSMLNSNEKEKYFSEYAIKERSKRRVDIDSPEFAKLIETELDKLLTILTT